MGITHKSDDALGIDGKYSDNFYFRAYPDNKNSQLFNSEDYYRENIIKINRILKSIIMAPDKVINDKENNYFKIYAISTETEKYAAEDYVNNKENTISNNNDNNYYSRTLYFLGG